MPVINLDISEYILWSKQDKIKIKKKKIIKSIVTENWILTFIHLFAHLLRAQQIYLFLLDCY